MLRITVELLPYGDESRKRTLGTILAANDGTGDALTGHYNVAELAEPEETFRQAKNRWVRVENHPRGISVWYLVAKALEALGYER